MKKILILAVMLVSNSMYASDHALALKIAEKCLSETTISSQETSVKECVSKAIAKTAIAEDCNNAVAKEETKKDTTKSESSEGPRISLVSVHPDGGHLYTNGEEVWLEDKYGNIWFTGFN